MKGLIAWFARNGVAANLLMLSIFGFGIYAMLARTPLEVFPSFELDFVNVRVPFPGATPSETEEGLTIKIEEAIFDLEGIESMQSTAAEGLGSVAVEVRSGYDSRELMEDIKTRVDAINTFPEEAEKPIVYIPERRREVISVVVWGDVTERELRGLGERVRDDLANMPEISQVELDGVRPYEISIEISETALQEYGLTLAQVAAAVSRSSLDLSAGAIRTAGGEVLLRTDGQAYTAAEFEQIPVLASPDGSNLTIGDIGVVRDGFAEDPVSSKFNGKRSVVVDVFRVGDQSAIEIANLVKDYVANAESQFPAGVSIDYWRDRSRILKARLSTLTKSALQGGLLILLLLTLFLRWSVAFWVFIGVPISFMGGLALMPALGVSINLISLFAFILVLGIVVDDAIVTGENIYKHLGRTGDATRAAIEGTQEVAVPVTFGILTTVAAFVPLLFVGGVRGQIFAQIPMIVIPVLLFSLVESKLILPAHLKHLHVIGDRDDSHSWPVRMQRKVANGLEAAIERFYRPLLGAAMRQRYLTLSIFVGIAVIVFSLVSAGFVRFIYFPRIQSEVARATLVMPAGTPFDVTSAQIERMTDVAESLRGEYIEPTTGESIIRGIYTTAGLAGGGSQPSSNVGRVMFEILPPEQRTIKTTSSEIVREWRKRIGRIPGARDLNFRAELGRGGAPIDVQVTGPEFDTLREVSAVVKERLATYPGVFDITDSFEDGKEEIELELKPAAELLGLSLSDLARQVRQAFFGFEVQRIQRGRDELKVMVRYPESERRSLVNLNMMRIRAPSGVEIPFSEVARAVPGRSVSSIRRIDRNRAINITADVNKESADVEAIKRDLRDFVSQAVGNYPGVRASLEGEAREQREAMQSILLGTFFVLFVIYALLAIPFRSYLQPAIVMSVIPFGIVGAILGHVLMGMNLSILSVFGMLALSGVVINDSLVLVDYVNRRRREGADLIDAVTQAGVARFRPVLLTSLTTFAGLTPLILEKTTQAQFLIPMAVSLGFGILFATMITLLLIPINYLMLEDVKHLFRRLVLKPA